MSELDCKTYSVFEIHPRATPKPSLTSRDNLHGRPQSRCCHALTASGTPLYRMYSTTVYGVSLIVDVLAAACSDHITARLQ